MLLDTSQLNVGFIEKILHIYLYLIGRSLFKLNDLDGALEHYQKVLAIDEEIAGEFHRDTATSISNVADVLKAQGKVDEAEKEIKRALNIRLKVLGRHTDVSRSYSQLGLLYHEKGLFDDALVEHNKALDINLELLGDKHPEVTS